MKALTIINHNNVETIDSREVAEMVGKQHKNLLADIRGYIEAMEKFTALKSEPSGTELKIQPSGELKIQPSDFFILSTYQDSTGRTLPCYLCTKKGCDMVANKTTGEKGVIFTAAYVTAFEQMREHIQTGKPLPNALAADRRSRAMLLNAKSRLADRMQKLYDRANVKPEYQVLALQDFFSEDGVNLPRIALQSTKVTYDKGTIAERLGVLSKTGIPHAQAIGAIIKQLKILPDEVESVPYCRNGHDGTDYQYTESVMQKINQWLSERGYPTELAFGSKTYTVRYCAAATRVGA